MGGSEALRRCLAKGHHPGLVLHSCVCEAKISSCYFLHLIFSFLLFCFIIFLFCFIFKVKRGLFWELFIL